MSDLYTQIEMRIRLAEAETQTITHFLAAWHEYGAEGVPLFVRVQTDNTLVPDILTACSALNRLLAVHRDLCQTGVDALNAEEPFDIPKVGAMVSRCLETVREVVKKMVGNHRLRSTRLAVHSSSTSSRRSPFRADSSSISPAIGKVRNRLWKLETLFQEEWPRSDRSAEQIRQSRDQASEGKVVSVEEMIRDLNQGSD